MKSGSPLGIGVIGCGTISFWTHLRNLASMGSVRVAGMADPDPAALERASRRLKAELFSDADSLLANVDIDAVIIASPTPFHAGQLAAASSAGKHVYLEKPIAHDAQSMAVALAVAENQDVQLAVGFNFRFHPACQNLRALLLDGAIGEVRAVFSDFCEPCDAAQLPAWKRSREQGGGVLLDLATHHVDMYRWFLRDELEWISADSRSMASDQDSAWIRAGTRGGVELGSYFSYTASRSHRISFHGTDGVLQLDLHSGRIRKMSERRPAYGVRTRTVSGGFLDFAWWSRKHIQPSYDPSHGRALSAFVDGIVNPAQRDVRLATIGDGARAVQAVLDAEANPGQAKSVHSATSVSA